jgi:hypothetical protein
MSMCFPAVQPRGPVMRERGEHEDAPSRQSR